ncbi:hypothetical protein BCR44DRAFT_55697 [Catenaria anguillulae PL171]|uniref:Uncharacterized protein n=1 Tax=Catenaria anguillulae PL171 TaxID=765915 RepID=A0A1Y2HTN5_9FUNG|nr:hypothetical protein BCR44DRAFT_55697 [Catenaria anguillulae PL171]
MSEFEVSSTNLSASQCPSPSEDASDHGADDQTVLPSDGNSPTDLELCHYSLTTFPDLTSVGTSLRKLVILAQDIDVIGDLSQCPQLELLWICETNVRDVEPLAACGGLVELYLYSNQIESIAALGGLGKLKRLWVNDNAISDISCLAGCSELEELCAANNAIFDIGPGITMNSNLQSVNIAGNNLYLIDVLETLGQLPNLTILILDHSFYGSNPLCDIPHYEIAVLCHCTHLAKLNEKLITDSMVSQAQSIQRKKRRFYEIAWQSAVSEYIGTALAQRDLVARSTSPLSYVLGYVDWAETTGFALDQRALGLHSDLLARIKDNHGGTTRSFRSLVLEQCKLRLMCTYLGGVTFAPTDSASIVALGVPLDRFLGDSDQCEAWAIEFPFVAPDDGVLLVTPVHEDLFLVSRGRLPIALFHGAESTAPVSQQDDCPESAIPHFVSKDYSDFRSGNRQRLESLLDDAAKTSSTRIDLSHMGISSLPSLTLPHVTQARLAFNSLYDLKQIFAVFPNVTRLDVSYNQITRLPDSYPPSLSFLDASGNRFGAECYDILVQWLHSIDEVVYDDYLLEEPLRLPNNYFLFPPASTVRPELDQVGQHPHPQVLASSILDSVHLSLGLKHVKHLSLRNCNLSSIEQLSRMHHLEHVYLAGNLLTSLASLVHLPSLHVVDVACNRISEVIPVTSTANSVSGHGSDSPSAPSTASSASHSHSRVFPRLTHLNICGNSVKTLDFVRKLGKLQELHIAHNQIMDAGQVNAIHGAHHLIVLDMRGNPFVASLLNYRSTVIYTSPALQVLDGAPVSDDEVACAKQLLVGCLTRTKLVDRLDTMSVRSLTCLDMRACGLVRIECFTPGEFSHLAFVNLDGNQLSDISNLVHLRALRCLSVSGNKLESLPDPAKVVSPGRVGAGKAGGMARSSSTDRDGGPLGLLWPSLAELYLDHNQFQRIADLFPESIALELRILSLRANKLVKLDGLERVRTMQKLYADGNQVRSIDVDVAGGMRSLKELSVNDNRIKSIIFVKHMPKLKYLYADRNRVTELVDVGSQTLLSISMVGNPISRVAAYRSVIQQIMPAVTRIDGAIVTEDEREAARAAVQLAPDSTQWQATGVPSQQPAKQALRFSNVTLDGSELGGGSTFQKSQCISVKTLTLGGNGVIGNGR